VPPPTRPGAVIRPGVPSAGNPFSGDFDGSGMRSAFLGAGSRQPWASRHVCAGPGTDRRVHTRPVEVSGERLPRTARQA